MSSNNSSMKAVLPYAEALLDSSKNLGLVNETSKSLSLILDQISNSVNLRNCLISPLLLPDAKKAILNELFAKQIDLHVLNFLYVLVERRRIALLQLVIQCYFDLVRKFQLVLIAEVNTAFPLTDLQKQIMQSKLKHATGSSEIRLVENINPDLIAGLIVKIGSKVIDMSVRGQLRQMSSYLNSACL